MRLLEDRVKKKSVCLVRRKEATFSEATLSIKENITEKENTLQFFRKKTEHRAFNYSKKATPEAEVSNVS